MNKLQRYWIDGGLCEMEPRGVFAECAHRIYLQDEADAVIAALEAARKEWEAKEKALRELARKWIIDDCHSPIVVRDGEVCGNELEAILNREQEKQ